MLLLEQVKERRLVRLLWGLEEAVIIIQVETLAVSFFFKELSCLGPKICQRLSNIERIISCFLIVSDWRWQLFQFFQTLRLSQITKVRLFRVFRLLNYTFLQAVDTVGLVRWHENNVLWCILDLWYVSIELLWLLGQILFGKVFNNGSKLGEIEYLRRLVRHLHVGGSKFVHIAFIQFFLITQANYTDDMKYIILTFRVIVCLVNYFASLRIL